MIQYPLSALLDIVCRGFRDTFGEFEFWGTAEILKVQQKGKFVYAEMVEYDEGGKICAKVKGCIFDEYVYLKFLQETKLESINQLNGLKILFHGRFSFHKEYNFSIIIDELNPEFTLGHLQKKQDAIIEELQKLGIVQKNKLLQWGVPPYTIAIISSDGAAGLSDFQAVLQQSGYTISYENYFCAMHGNNAIAAVGQELQNITKDIKKGKKIDGVVIVRGGGESSGIIWQNDLEIAKSICLMPVPLIVAIGHTPDKFILQDLAWYGAKTPTDAAYRILEELTMWDDAIELLYVSIVEQCTEKLDTIRENIDEWMLYINNKLDSFMREVRLQIDGWFTAISAISPEKLTQQGYALLLQEGQYLTKSDVNQLETGDRLEVHVYDRQFIVTITEKL